MSNIKSFVEHSNSIRLKDFVEEVRKVDPEVDEVLKEGGDIRNIVNDYLMSSFSSPYYDWEKSKTFPFEKVDTYSESDDKAEHVTSIFKRKIDGKFFNLTISINHFGFGPEIIYLPEYLYEVTPKKIETTKWQ
jgi:hypothetical protein